MSGTVILIFEKLEPVPCTFHVLPSIWVLLGAQKVLKVLIEPLSSAIVKNSRLFIVPVFVSLLVEISHNQIVTSPCWFADLACFW